MNRFYITKLVLRGDNLQDAELNFSTGLNAVTGASDTGKSLVYNAINYALGASKTPILPPEAMGYDRVFLELSQSKGSQSTVMRSFLSSESSKIYVFEAGIEALDVDRYELYSTGSRAKKKYSDYLMKLFDCPYSTLLISNGEDSRSFTFRAFAHLIMLSETKVYAAHSPIYESDTSSDVSRPAALSAFHVLLKGADDPAPPKKVKADISRAKLMGQKEQLEALCVELEKDIIALKASIGGWQYTNIEAEIHRVECKIAEQRQKLDHMQSNFTFQKQVLLELGEKHLRIHDTMLRMELLKQNYESDMDRLEFIDEAHALTEQFIKIDCPICHSAHTIESVSASKSLFQEAAVAERLKLGKQLTDLSITISDFADEERAVESRIVEIDTDLLCIRKEIDTLLKNGLNEALEELEQYKNSRDSFVEVQRKDETLLEYKNMIDTLDEKIVNSKKRKKTDYETLPSYLDELGSFCHYVSVYLSNWSFSSERVSFNRSEQDLIVGNKDKRAFGQGARALINSAFILALLDYSMETGYAHPGFVMIDSPLTTFKDKDSNSNIAQTEDISQSVKQEFYSYLSQCPHDRQIIVFDNEEPSQKLEGIVYHHFSGNSNIGRAGFIPPKVQVSLSDKENG